MGAQRVHTSKALGTMSIGGHWSFPPAIRD
jgi:hypothetical protein